MKGTEAMSVARLFCLFVALDVVLWAGDGGAVLRETAAGGGAATVFQ